MIDFYCWSTPNGRKVSIMLEECALNYQLHEINIGKDEQFAPEFLAISPNNKIPAILDRDNGQSVFESGAILIYLAEKTGQFMPANPQARLSCLEWLMFQMGGLGPMLGQVHHFVKFNPGKAAYAEERYANEAKRLYGVCDRRLAQVPYFAGQDYTIADMAIWPWISRFQWQQMDLNLYPNLLDWYRRVAARPGVIRGYDVPKRDLAIPMPE